MSGSSVVSGLGGRRGTRPGVSCDGIYNDVCSREAGARRFNALSLLT